MITTHARPRQTDERTNIMAIAQRFVLTTLKIALYFMDSYNILSISLRQSAYKCVDPELYNYRRRRKAATIPVIKFM